MNITPEEITIRDLAEGYHDDAEKGVFGYGGKLNIRPPYQREFVYKDKQRDDVIRSVIKKFPLNIMYWVEKNDGTYELLDGQQRTISICQYVAGDFSVDKTTISDESKTFLNLRDSKDDFLDYKLTVYVCKGGDNEIIDWFKIINIGSVELTNQEMLNAVYNGPWVTDAKRYFSKRGCPAYEKAAGYMAGTSIRQDYLEAAIKWINNGDVEGYMDAHRNDKSAKPLWDYFQEVIKWVKATFPTKRKQMKGPPWGKFYNEFKDKNLSPAKLEKEIARLMEDDDVTDYNGIYAYVLTRQEKHLNIRAFKDHHKSAAYKRQKGVCPGCKKKFTSEEMEADHIKPWSKGGKTEPSNCQMLCRDCNRRKSNK